MSGPGRKNIRKYRDKIMAQEQDQKEKESEFSAIMAEMEELKHHGAMPGGRPVPVQQSNRNTDNLAPFQSTFSGSLPNMSNQYCYQYANQQNYTAQQIPGPPSNSGNTMFQPTFQYSGGGIIRQHSRERVSSPYSRSRSPSPNPFHDSSLSRLPGQEILSRPISPCNFGGEATNYAGSKQVILTHRENYKLPTSNRLQPPGTHRQRSLSDSRLNDQNFNLPDIIHELQLGNLSTDILKQSGTQHKQHVPGENLNSLQLSNITHLSSPAPQRRRTEADIFHSQFKKNPDRKLSEPCSVSSPKIVVTFHDHSNLPTENNPFTMALNQHNPAENPKNLRENYHVYQHSNPDSPESDFSTQNSPGGSTGEPETIGNLDQSELTKKMYEFQLNNPPTLQSKEPDLQFLLNSESMDFYASSSRESNNLLSTNEFSQSQNLPTHVEELARSEVLEDEQSIDFDGDAILKQLSN